MLDFVPSKTYNLRVTPQETTLTVFLAANGTQFDYRLLGEPSTTKPPVVS